MPLNLYFYSLGHHNDTRGVSHNGHRVSEIQNRNQTRDKDIEGNLDQLCHLLPTKINV